jgi:hypothetical protein
MSNETFRTDSDHATATGNHESGPAAFDDPAFQTDPYPTYAWMRAHEPVGVREAEPDLVYWVMRYDDCVGVLRDPRFSSAREIGGLHGLGVPERFRRLGALLANMMLLKDEPDHLRLRGLVNKAFTPRVVERARPRVEALVDQLLDEVVAQGTSRMDVIRDVATPLPVMVIAELLGVPVDDLGRFKQWSDEISVLIDGSVRMAGIPQAADSMGELGEYLRGVMAARRREPQPDLMSALLAARDREDRLTEDELIANCVLLLLAGHETTNNLIGNGVFALLRHPEELARLRNDPALAASAAEECLRYDAPIQLTSRKALEDVRIGDVVVEKGAEVDVFLGSANRDAAQFAEPDRFDVGRRATNHLSFGHGAHFCLGAPLARLEGEIALRRLAQRMPQLALEPGEPPRRPGLVLRGFSSLPVRF